MKELLSKPPSIKSQSWEFNNIQIGHAISSYDQLGSTFKAANSEDTVRLHMGLRGDYNFKLRQLHKTYDLVGGHHNIIYSNGIDLEITNKSDEVETFGINFPKQVFIDLLQDEDDSLRQFCKDVIAGNTIVIAEKWGTITSPIQTVLDEIIMNPYKSTLQNIFLFAKTLELLVLCIDNYKNIRSKSYHYLRTTADKEAIVAARDLIIKHVSNPLGLSEIAKRVGVNEFKLKYGFKEMFGTTLFSYLREKRLGLATQYLSDTDKAISLIAEELGFSSPQHFSNQYKQKFGVSPKEVRSL